jgi:hypothetical protein
VVEVNIANNNVGTARPDTPRGNKVSPEDALAQGLAQINAERAEKAPVAG